MTLAIYVDDLGDYNLLGLAFVDDGHGNGASHEEASDNACSTHFD